jgi:hypothetical protein
MKVLKPPQSGKLGNTVAKHNRYGQYETETVSPKKPNTPSRKRARGMMERISHLWSELTEAQRESWRRAALQVESRPRAGQSGRLTGQALFVKINFVLATCGRGLRTDPPGPAAFDSNPVGALAITHDLNSVTLRLSVGAAPRQDIMVFASPPYSRGRAFCNTFGFIGVLPTPTEQVSDVTRLYGKKYGVPSAGARIFIRTWPQENGWEGKAQTRIAYADVPASERGQGRQAGRRARARKG